MSYWNQGYNRKKQLGIQPNQHNKTIKAPHHNIFGGRPSSSSLQQAREQRRKDKFAWKVGIFVMTIISIVGIYALYWAATL
jgi:hypothetical protein